MAINNSAADIRDHPDWSTGDFTLVSADGWRFKVWSHHIAAARLVHYPGGNWVDDTSDFFRVASRDTPMTLIFSNADLESKRILAFFAHLLTNPIADMKADGALTVEEHLTFIEFLRKYDCVHTQQVYSMFLTRELCRGQLLPSSLWTLGAALDDVDLCTGALKTETQTYLHTPTYDRPSFRVARFDLFNVCDLPLKALASIPPAHLYALSGVRKDSVEKQASQEGKQSDYVAALNASFRYKPLLEAAKRTLAPSKDTEKTSPQATNVKCRRS